MRPTTACNGIGSVGLVLWHTALDASPSLPAWFPKKRSYAYTENRPISRQGAVSVMLSLSFGLICACL